MVHAGAPLTLDLRGTARNVDLRNIDRKDPVVAPTGRDELRMKLRFPSEAERIEARNRAVPDISRTIFTRRAVPVRSDKPLRVRAEPSETARPIAVIGPDEVFRVAPRQGEWWPARLRDGTEDANLNKVVDTGETDPLRRYEAIRDATFRAKRTHQVVGADLMIRLTGFVPAVLNARIARIQNDAQVWGVNHLAKVISGDDPMGAIGDLAALAAGFGLISAWLTPRGPITTGEALITMAMAVLIGLGAGLVTGNRWSMLATPVVFVVVFELARMGTVGPTVDAINLSGLYGIIALVLGRGVYGILALAPMLLGASYGVWLAARLGHPAAPLMGGVGWTVSGLVTLTLAAVAFFIATPATTAPVVGADGEPLPGSVAELVTVPIGGHDQTMLIRGRSTDSPVLLYLTGGPGGTDLGAIRRDVTLEQDFVVVVWDQRGAGKSYGSLDPTDTFTLDQMVSDTIEVTDYLRDRFDQDKVFLVGQSWGSTLGVLAAQRHNVDGCEPQVGRHAHLRHRDEVPFQHGIVYVPSRQHVGERVPHQFADAQSALRRSGAGVSAMLPCHGSSSLRAPGAAQHHKRVHARLRALW